MNPKVFGTEHLVYTLIFLILSFTGLFLTKKYAKTEKSKTIVIKITAIVLFLAIMANRISLCIANNSVRSMVIGSYCGMSSLLFSLFLLFGKKNSSLINFIAYPALFGGLITMVYPEFISQSSSVFYAPTITGLLHHSLSLYTALLVLITGYMVPSFKKWAAFPLGMCVLVTYGVFLYCIEFYPNPMELFAPMVSGTFLTWYTVAPMYIAIQTLIVCAYEFFAKKKRKTEENKKTD